jgi:hypothetical protein
MTPHFGKDRRPWKVGLTRKIHPDITLQLCRKGYHYARTWEDAFLGGFIYGPRACIVKVDTSGPKDNLKGCSRERTLVEVFYISPSDFKKWKFRIHTSKNAKLFAEFMGKKTGWVDVPVKKKV